MKRERLDDVQVTTIEQAVKQVAAALREDVVKQRVSYYNWVIENYKKQVALLEAAITDGTRVKAPSEAKVKAALGSK